MKNLKDMHAIELPKEFTSKGFAAWRAGDSDVAFVAYLGVPVLRIDANCEPEWIAASELQDLAYDALEGSPEGEGHDFIAFCELVNDAIR